MAAAAPLDLATQVIARVVRLSETAPHHLEFDLNEHDRERANRFRFAEDRARLVVGRALLSRLLHRHLGHSFGRVELEYTDQGRPLLRDHPHVQFSISHSGDLVAVALAADTLVGIDVQQFGKLSNLPALAQRIFSDDDLKLFQALPEDAANAAFFRAWTGKEAALKAQGRGLAGGLKEISIPFSADFAAAQPLPGWCLERLPLAGDYSGHVAWNDLGKALDFREIKLEETP